MSLYSQIKKYHFQKLDDLRKHQLHFLSRLWFWENNKLAGKLLIDRRSTFLNQNLKFKTVSIHTDSKNPLRAKYLKKFPHLLSQNAALFTWLFRQNIYGLDSRKTLYQHHSLASLTKTYHRLLRNPEAIAFISAQAVNVLSIYSVSLKPKTKPLTCNFFLDLLPYYQLNDHITLRLKAYLLTHAIIGQSAFYTKKITRPQNWLPLIKELDQLIANNYLAISLDIKFEYLVCCRLLNYRSPLKKRIYTEANKSLSKRGSFLLDKQNHHRGKTTTRFSKSEHRNVLFLMSCSKPQYHKNNQ